MSKSERVRYNVSHIPRTATLRDPTQGASRAWAQRVGPRANAGWWRPSAWARKDLGTHPSRPRRSTANAPLRGVVCYASFVPIRTLAQKTGKDVPSYGARGGLCQGSPFPS